MLCSTARLNSQDTRSAHGCTLALSRNIRSDSSFWLVSLDTAACASGSCVAGPSISCAASASPSVVCSWVVHLVQKHALVCVCDLQPPRHRCTLHGVPQLQRLQLQRLLLLQRLKLGSDALRRNAWQYCSTVRGAGAAGATAPPSVSAAPTPSASRMCFGSAAAQFVVMYSSPVVPLMKASASVLRGYKPDHAPKHDARDVAAQSGHLLAEDGVHLRVRPAVRDLVVVRVLAGQKDGDDLLHDAVLDGDRALVTVVAVHVRALPLVVARASGLADVLHQLV